MAPSSDALVKLKLLGSREFASDAGHAERGLKGVSTAAGRVDSSMTTAAPQRYARGLSHVSREARGAERSIHALGKARDHVGSGLSFAKAGVAGATIGGFYELGRGIHFAGTEYAESVKAGAQTKAVIKSTGGAAGVTAKHVNSLATSLSKKTAIDDEQIQSSENLLLTFSKIKKQGGIFDRATASALDLSAAGFGSVSTESKQLGKALNDPVKGMTALSKSGVTFTAKQQSVIKSLVATGDTLGAQKKIMSAVEFQVKGSAAATATPLGHLKTNIANVAEQLGYLGAPVANKGISALADLSGRINSIAGRKDLSLEDKLKLTAGAAGRIFAPLVDGAGREIQRMHLGTRLSDAVEWAAPKIADAMATAAPRAAKAFITAFKEEGPWGKLLTVGFLASKMSFVWQGLGTLMMRKFIRKQVAVMVADTTLAGAARAPAALAGTAFSTTFAATAAVETEATAVARSGGLFTAFSTLGKALGGVAAVGLLFELNKQIKGANPVSDALKTAGTNVKDALSPMSPHAPFPNAKPGSAQDAINRTRGDSITGSVGAQLGGGVVAGKGITGQRTGGSRPPRKGRALASLASYTPSRYTPSPRPTVIHNYIHLDGREIHRSVVRHEARLQDQG